MCLEAHGRTNRLINKLIYTDENLALARADKLELTGRIDGGVVAGELLLIFITIGGVTNAGG